MSELMIENAEASQQPCMAPLVSVVTVTLNDRDGLAKTVKSVMAQTVVDRLEHIIVDGASGYDVAGMIAGMGSDARLLSEPDQGLFDAMNKGIDLAIGTYVIFMNSGDAFADPAIVQSVVDVAQEPLPDIIYGDSLERLESGEVVYKRGRDIRWIGIGMNTHHQSIFYKLKLLNQHQIRYNLAYRLAGDYEFTVRSYQASGHTTRLDTPVSLFQSGGLSQVKYSEAHQEQARIREDVYRSRSFARLVLFAQHLNGVLRRRMPAVYWSLKK